MMRDHLIQADGAAASLEGTVILARPSALAAELLLRADDDVVLIVAGVESGGVLAGDQRVERHFDIHHADAEIGGARAVDFQAHFRLAGAQGGIGIHQRRGWLSFLRAAPAEYVASFCRSGPWMKYWISALL